MPAHLRRLARLINPEWVTYQPFSKKRRSPFATEKLNFSVRFASALGKSSRGAFLSVISHTACSVRSMSSFNSIRQGLLSKRLPLLYGQSKRHFNHLLTSLQQDLEPVGALEVLVEKIAKGIGDLVLRYGMKLRHSSTGILSPDIGSRRSCDTRRQSTVRSSKPSTNSRDCSDSTRGTLCQRRST